MTLLSFTERLRRRFTGSISPARGGDVEFCVLAEAGVLEAQALLLCSSIRRFAGAYSSAAVVVVSPRPDRRPCRTTLRHLDRMGVEYVELDIRSPYPSFGPSFKILAVAHISRRPGPPIIVQIDSDTLFLGEPDFTLDGVDVAARPVDVKGMCTAGEGDPFDEFWHHLCALCEVDYSRVPVLETTVDRKAVRASYNGGLVVAKRNRGILERTAEFLERALLVDARPHRGSVVLVESGAGAVSAEASEYWGIGQAVLSLAITATDSKVRILPTSHNVPIHFLDLLERSDTTPVHVHYHWLCSSEGCSANPMLDGRMALPADTVKWLRERLPLNGVNTFASASFSS
jgi:hypothetical protein